MSIKLHSNVLVPVNSMEMLWLVWRKFSNWLKVNALKCFNISIDFCQACFGRKHVFNDVLATLSCSKP